MITLGGNVGADAGSASLLKSVTAIAKGGIKLSGDITTSSTADGAVTLTGPVTLEADVIIDADAANTTVSFGSTSTVNSDSTARDLTINTNGGKVTMDAAIGGSAAIDVLKINSDTTGAADIDLAGLGGSNSGVTNATTIGNSNTNQITLDGTVYKLSLIHI